MLNSGIAKHGKSEFTFLMKGFPLRGSCQPKAD